VFPALSIYQALVADGVKVHLFTDERGTRYASDFAPEDVQVFPSGGSQTSASSHQVCASLARR